MSIKEFNYQVVAHQSPLKAFALSLTKDYEDAMDLMQDTLTKALVYRTKYSEEFNFKAWIFTIMRNTFFNNYKRGQKTNEIFSQADVFNVSKEDLNNNPETFHNYKEIRKAVDELDDFYRVPFEMYNEGYKYQEIAEELNLAIGTVKSRIFFARKKLSEQLAEYR